MNVLVVGGGGREHALAEAIARSPRCEQLFVAPGNAGTPGTAVPIDATDIESLVSFASDEAVDLVVVGPESALAAGLADALTGAGIAVFGPSRAAAQLEWSKSYARDVADALGVPSPRYGRFDDAESAIEWFTAFKAPVVVKLSGLAAGKGVVVPEDAAATEVAIRRLVEVGEIVLEERLSGPEISLLALCDGHVARPLPMAQDHKRIGEGDTGPNTGGMGAYAPAPVPFDADDLTATFVQPVVDHLAAGGTPFVGVLYAGLMLTAGGPRLLEFNCRFGDPEAQAVLPLLDCDLLDLLVACCEGRLSDAEVRVRPGAACTVVAAAAGYPDNPAVGQPITMRPPGPDVHVFHAGTRCDAEGRLVTSGGRVLAVTGLGVDLAAARAAAYAAMDEIAFDGKVLRRDIGWRAAGAGLDSYAAAGVDVVEGQRAVNLLAGSVERTHTDAVMAGVGSFGGALDVSGLKDLAHPVLVASTDGVGTKVELAARAGRPAVAGHDIVNHCVNDVLVQGARPMFFLDYIASARLDAALVAAVVDGMATACADVGCVLLGGETAEMPGVYVDGAFDVAGTLVGVVDRAAMLPRPGVGVGDVLVALGSSGPHTNGYSFLRRLFAWLPLDAQPEPLDVPLGDALLAPHRSYLDALGPVLDHPGLKALAHITGGGLVDNVPRVLPKGVSAEITLGSWPVPPLFRLVRDLVPDMTAAELHRTLNMGVGMVLVCAHDEVEAIRGRIDEPTWVIGDLVANEDGAPEVRLV